MVEELLGDLQRRGIVVTLTDTGIRVGPPRLVTDEDRLRLREQRPELIRYLETARYIDIPEELRSELHRRGIEVEKDGDNLKARSKNGLTDDDREFLAMNKIECMNMFDPDWVPHWFVLGRSPLINDIWDGLMRGADWTNRAFRDETMNPYFDWAKRTLEQAKLLDAILTRKLVLWEMVDGEPVLKTLAEAKEAMAKQKDNGT